MPDAAEFFDRYHLGVYRYFLRLTGEADLAEDLTQDVFVRIVRSTGRYAAQGCEEAWVFTIARTVHAEHARQTDRAPRVISLAEAPDCGEEPEHVVALGVREALRLLPRPGSSSDTGWVFSVVGKDAEPTPVAKALTFVPVVGLAHHWGA